VVVGLNCSRTRCACKIGACGRARYDAGLSLRACGRVRYDGGLSLRAEDPGRLGPEEQY
jgi:hypothetical protein